MKIRVGFGLGTRSFTNDHSTFDPFVDSLEELGFDSLWLSERLGGECPDPIVGLAYVYEAMEDYENAIDLYKTAINSKGNFPLFQVYWSLARCHENNKDISNALLILREMQIKFSSDAELEKIDKKIKNLSYKKC